MDNLKPLRSSTGRERLSKVLRVSRELITVDDVVSALDVSRRKAALMLARWMRQGWLTRIKRGLYAPIPIGAASKEQVLSDPLMVVPQLFEPGYVGGWTAAEHWDLTEQIFIGIRVFTTRTVRARNVRFQNVPFLLKHVRSSTIFGLRSIWRERIKIQISDPHKTIIDMLDDPKVGGGIRHVESCLSAYFDSKHINTDTLLGYAIKQGNGAVFKRLGFLASRLREQDKILQTACAEHLTKGNARLDPSQPAGRLLTRWKLWVPEGWQSGTKE